MSSTPNNPAAAGGRGSGIPRVIVATTALLTFISFWRAAAIVLNDLASSAYYAGGEAEAYIGKTAPWFILAIMIFSYAVRAVYVESCSMFVRGGVYRAVKMSLGGGLAKFSVSALMFDYILTGPISGVAAGQYLAGLTSELLQYFHLSGPLSPGRVDLIAASFAIIVTLYFWWENTKGVHESSEKALYIMKLVTVMVVLLIGWCIYTVIVRHSALPPLPHPKNLHLTDSALGWLVHSPLPHMFGIIAIFVALGHSVLAMSGEESLAQVYREIESPKLPNLKKAGLVIFIYSLVFTSLVSFFAVMIIPDDVRQGFLENLIGGLAMNLEGPLVVRLIFHAFVVVVGTFILAGAVNTAIVGSNGVLNRVSEDGVLSDWFRQPHKRFGTSYRIINIVVFLQILTIIISRGDVTFLANLYAFGVVWSFAMNGLAVLVLRYTRPGEREFQVPLNFNFRGVQIPVGLSLITLILFLIAVTNLFTKPVATMAGGAFSILLYLVFTFSERRGKRGGVAHVEMDQFNLELEGALTPEAVGARPGNILVPVSNHYALYHLGNVLDRIKPGRRDVVVLHVRLLRRSVTGESEMDADQLFGSIEQHLFSQALSMAEKRGKSIRLAVVAANDLWDGILRAGQSLQSSTIVVGTSSRWMNEEQARTIGDAWEKLGDQKPQFNLEIHFPNGDKVYKVLGPHAPNLTANEVNLLHRLWLRFSDVLAPQELHHHDVVHFALEEVQKELDEGHEEIVVKRLRDHLEANQTKRKPSP
ncbi:MAG TPA: APC family permease [Candidatus Saccharimonadales bacterium]|jgi:amino acid transporter|nr:APC family permease [Candidatus Saccharimonadales bacterium]